MRSTGARTLAVVSGVVLAVASIGLLAAGAGLLWAHSASRDATGYYTTPQVSVSTAGYAIVAGVDFGAGSVNLEAADLLGNVRLRASASDGHPIFMGLAPAAKVASWLAGVAHQQFSALPAGGPGAEGRWVAGSGAAGLPGAQTFWTTSAEGGGTQTLVWAPSSGSWSVVIMSADAARGVAVSADVGAESALLLPLGAAGAVLGLILLAAAAFLISLGAGSSRTAEPTAPEPAPEATVGTRYPVRLEGRVDPELGRWLWLVKWGTPAVCMGHTRPGRGGQRPPRLSLARAMMASAE